MLHWMSATACGLLWLVLVIGAPHEARTAWPRMRRHGWRRMAWVANAAYLSIALTPIEAAHVAGLDLISLVITSGALT